MKIYLGSASLEDIRWAAARRLIDGVVTSHELMRGQELDSERDRLVDICRAAPGSVFVASHAVTSAETYRDGRDLARLSDQMIVQVPFIEDTIDAIHRLSSDGVRVAATLVFNAAQAVLAARVGATAVVVSIDELEVAGHDAVAVLRELRLVLDAAGCETDIIASQPTTAAHFAACAATGADAIAVSADTLRSLLVHPLTDRGVDQLLQVLSRQHVSWSLA